MADMHDFTPATRRMAELVAGVPEDSLGAPTPCSDYTVGDLLDHIGSLTVAFASIAAKSVSRFSGAAWRTMRAPGASGWIMACRTRRPDQAIDARPAPR